MKWVDRSLYPFQSRFAELSSGKMHYIDEGTGDPILFIHGTPTWSFLYRGFVREYVSQFRCIAPDHLGFGLSEKSQGFDGRVPWHAENLKEFIEHLDLQNISLLVHDFGGPIGLGAALDLKDRFKRIVIMNTWLWETGFKPTGTKSG